MLCIIETFEKNFVNNLNIIFVLYVFVWRFATYWCNYLLISVDRIQMYRSRFVFGQKRFFVIIVVLKIKRVSVLFFLQFRNSISILRKKIFFLNLNKAKET